MRILLLSHYLLPHIGGVEVMTDMEARLLAEQGHEVTVLCSDARGASNGDTSDPEYPPGVRVVRIQAWNGPERWFHIPWPVFSPALIPILWWLVRWSDAVHVNGYLYMNCVLGLIFARLQGRRALLSEHIGHAWYSSRLKRLVQWAAVESVGRLSARLAHESTGCHDRVVRALQRLGGPRASVRLLPNPLNRALFRPPCADERRAARAALGWEPERPKVLFVGRLIARKGIDLLLQAQDPRYDLVFCGWGDVGLLGSIPNQGLSYLSPRRNEALVQLYHAADVLAIPSRAEGNLSMAAQEALACGLPVVHGEDAGLSRFLGLTGLQFCELNPDAIRAALCDVVDAERTIPEQISASFYKLVPDGREWLDRLYVAKSSGSLRYSNDLR